MLLVSILTTIRVNLGNKLLVHVNICAEFTFPAQLLGMCIVVSVECNFNKTLITVIIILIENFLDASHCLMEH